MTHRPVPYRADPAIVVLDIDEASLAALAPPFGRWPWPRQVLANVASHVERGGAQAVLFDILFADPDLASNGGDAGFDRYVSLPAGRSASPLSGSIPKNDSQSSIPVSMLNLPSRKVVCLPIPNARLH